MKKKILALIFLIMGLIGIFTLSDKHMADASPKDITVVIESPDGETIAGRADGYAREGDNTISIYMDGKHYVTGIQNILIIEE